MKTEKLSIKIEKMTTNDVDEIFKIEEETYHMIKHIKLLEYSKKDQIKYFLKNIKR